jgi:hypothetical protein
VERETLLERVPLLICRLGWVGGRAETGGGRVDARYGGEASRGLNVGGDGGNTYELASRVQKRQTSSREREKGTRPRDGAAPALKGEVEKKSNKNEHMPLFSESWTE